MPFVLLIGVKISVLEREIMSMKIEIHDGTVKQLLALHTDLPVFQQDNDR